MPKLTLWLPNQEPAKYTCTVPVAEGEICGKKFPARQTSLFEKHVRQCVKDHAHVIEQERPAVKRDVLFGIADKELDDWLHRDGKANSVAVAEGRKRLS